MPKDKDATDTHRERRANDGRLPSPSARVAVLERRRRTATPSPSRFSGAISSDRGTADDLEGDPSPHGTDRIQPIRRLRRTRRSVELPNTTTPSRARGRTDSFPASDRARRVQARLRELKPFGGYIPGHRSVRLLKIAAEIFLLLRCGICPGRTRARGRWRPSRRQQRRPPDIFASATAR